MAKAVAPTFRTSRGELTLAAVQAYTNWY